MNIEVYYEYHRGQVASLQLTGLSFLAMRRRQLQADESNAERSCILNLAAFDLTKNKISYQSFTEKFNPMPGKT